MPKMDPLARAGRRWRRAVKLAAGALAPTLLLLGVATIATGPAAYASVGSAPYTIGTPTDAVSSVVASPPTVVQGAGTDFSIKFLATAPLSGGQASAVTVSSSTSLGSVPSDVALIDDTNTGCFQGALNGGAASDTSLTVDLVGSCQVSAGDLLEIAFTADSPVASGSFHFEVTTSGNGIPAVSEAVIVTNSPPTLGATSVDLGANATYTISGASWTSSTVSGNFAALRLTAKATSGTTMVWYGGAAGYSVIYTPPSGVPTADVVDGATVSATTNMGDTVTLALSTSLGAGDQVSIGGKGTNPSVASSDQVTVTPEAAPGAAPNAAGTTDTSSNTVVFGTSVTEVTVSASPPVAGATATYAVSFDATSALPGGPGANICLDEAAGPTTFSTGSGVLVTDTTAGWHFVAPGVTFPSGNPPTNPGCGTLDNGEVIPLVSGYAVRAGDFVTLTLVDVTNPGVGTVSDFFVSTTADAVGGDAAPYTIGASANPGVLVTASPSTTGSLATYTISDLVASSPMTGGTSTITIEGPSGTVFPNSPGFYTVEDSTTPSASGTVTAPVSNGGTNDVAMTVPEAINGGDQLSLTVEDVINPSSAGASYDITLLGSVTGSAAVAAFPRANLAYPNGAIVNFSGTDYVFAGGHAFGVATAANLAALEKVDHAATMVAPVGTSPPSVAPRPGTLVFTRPLNGASTIFVAGTDGELHGFASPAQFLADGYDPALVVTVPSLRGLAIGATAGIRRLSCRCAFYQRRRGHRGVLGRLLRLRRRPCPRHTQPGVPTYRGRGG